MWELIESVDDPRLATFRDLPLRKGGIVPSRGGSGEGRGHQDPGDFVAEGRLVVERLLDSPYETTSFFIAESKRSWLDDTVGSRSTQTPELERIPWFVLPDRCMGEVVGFQFHSGIMASGRRRMPLALSRKVEAWFSPPVDGEVMDRVTLLALPAMQSPENLGSLVRSARGLGGQVVILSPASADPLSRRVLRVSMGHSLYMPYFQTVDWLTDLERLREAGFRLIGFENHANMSLLGSAPRYPRQVLVFGNEFEGLNSEILARMDEIVGIPMSIGVDSLNVSVAGALALYHYSGVNDPKLPV